MRVQSHFTMLVYPFQHAVSGNDKKLRLQRLSKRWQHWWGRFDDKGLARALDDTYFFLPYVRQMLFPEIVPRLLPQGDALQQTPRAKELAGLPLDELAARLDPNGVLRFTCQPEQLKELHPLALEYEDKKDRFLASIKINWIDVVLFPQNVGFLILKVNLTTEDLTVDSINDFLYYARLVHPPAIDWNLARWKCTKGKTQVSLLSRDLVDFLLQGLTACSDQLDATIDSFADHLQQDGSAWRYSSTNEGQVYGQMFRLYSYACLAEPQPATAGGEMPHEDAGQPSQSSVRKHSLFDSPVQQMLYELATCKKTTLPDEKPHPLGLKQTMEKGHIALWANWEGMALHDSVVFLANSPTGFTQGALAHNVESDYFHLYLLTLYQKMRLSLLSGELMRHGPELHKNLEEARRLWDDFVMFRNHYWFAEVTLKPQGTVIYRSFQRGLDALSLYESVKSEVHELQDYYERKDHRQIEETTRQMQQEMRNLLASTKDNMDVVAHVQVKVEWIEIFLVSVYFAHLWEMFNTHARLWEWSGSVLVVALISGLIAAWVLKPRKHRSHRRLKERQEEKP